MVRSSSSESESESEDDSSELDGSGVGSLTFLLFLDFFSSFLA
jgi:hypothetical protein